MYYILFFFTPYCCAGADLIVSCASSIIKQLIFNICSPMLKNNICPQPVAARTCWNHCPTGSGPKSLQFSSEPHKLTLTRIYMYSIHWKEFTKLRYQVSAHYTGVTAAPDHPNECNYKEKKCYSIHLGTSPQNMRSCLISRYQDPLNFPWVIGCLSEGGSAGRHSVESALPSPKDKCPSKKSPRTQYSVTWMEWSWSACLVFICEYCLYCPSLYLWVILPSLGIFSSFPHLYCYPERDCFGATFLPSTFLHQGRHWP